MVTTDYLDYVVDKETHILIVGRSIRWAGNLEAYEMDKAAVHLTLVQLLLCVLTAVQCDQLPPYSSSWDSLACMSCSLTL